MLSKHKKINECKYLESLGSIIFLDNKNSILLKFSPMALFFLQKVIVILWVCSTSDKSNKICHFRGSIESFSLYTREKLA